MLNDTKTVATFPRKPCHGDMIALARALATVPRRQRRGRAAAIIADAAEANEFRRRYGRQHWIKGDGSIMPAALRWPCQNEGTLSDPEWLYCLSAALDALTEIAVMQMGYSGAAE